MKIKGLLSALLVSMLLLSSVACSSGEGGNASNGDNGSNDAVDTTTAETTAAPVGYDYGDTDYDGYSFRVLNFDEQFECYVRLDVEEQSGDRLDDAVYERNNYVEDKLNFEFEEVIYPFVTWSTDQVNICRQFINSVMAGDDDFDAAYLPVYFHIDAVTGGSALNLCDIPELNLYADYWDGVINEGLTINGKLYTAASPLHLMPFDLSWCLLFNQSMMDDLGMEYPYDAVRDGSWTLDKMTELVEKGAALNSASSFTSVKQDEDSVYGIAGHSGSSKAFLLSAGYSFYSRSSDGGFELTGLSDRLVGAMEKICKLTTLSDGRIFYQDAAAQPTSYLNMFRADRGLFCTIELKCALQLRDMESTFGLVPMPKYDEKQEDYTSLSSQNSCLLAIPNTQKDTSRAGTILDALSYESAERVLPVYYEVTVSQKGLRNEDSIEMMEIIRNNRVIDAMYFYNVTSSMVSSLESMIRRGDGDATGTASAVEKNLSAAQAKLEELTTLFGK